MHRCLIWFQMMRTTIRVSNRHCNLSTLRSYERDLSILSAGAHLVGASRKWLYSAQWQTTWSRTWTTCGLRRFCHIALSPPPSTPFRGAPSSTRNRACRAPNNPHTEMTLSWYSYANPYHFMEIFHVYTGLYGYLIYKCTLLGIQTPNYRDLLVHLTYDWLYRWRWSTLAHQAFEIRGDQFATAIVWRQNTQN